MSAPMTAEALPVAAETAAMATRSSASPASAINIHLPSPQALKSSQGPNITHPPPRATWLHGTWQVTHSTLPMWKGKANVRITYTPMPQAEGSTAVDAAGADEPQPVDDLVEYQKEGSDKVSSVHGVSRPMDVDGFSDKGWAYHWRGKGWLMIASSHWEILGHGHETIEGGTDGNKWVVTYFSSTLFTPAGLDVYSQDPAGLKAENLEEIKKQLQGLGNETLSKLAGELFAIPRK